MKKSILLLALCMIFVLSACAAKQVDENADLYAITDEASPLEFEMEEDVQIQTVPAQADEAVAAVQDLMKGWGYINLKGEWVIAPQYDDAYPFVDNVATVKVKDGGWKLINKSNDTIAEFPAGLTVVEQDQPPVYGRGVDGNKNPSISEGMIVLVKDEGRGYSKSGDLYGFADTTGKIIVEPKYVAVQSFQDGLAAVNLSTDPYENSWSYIDKTGAVVIDGNFRGAMHFSGGVADITYNDDTYSGALIDKTGAVVAVPTSNGYVGLLGFYTDGVAPAYIGPKKFGIVDTQGNVVKVVVDGGPANFYGDFSGVLFTTFMDGLYSFNDGSQPAAENGYFPQGFIDTEGNIVIDPQYEWIVAGQFSEGLCAVAKEEKIGFIDKTGNLAIPYQFDYAYPFTFGLAAVGINDVGITYKYIDPTGNTVIEIQDVSSALPFTK